MTSKFLLQPESFTQPLLNKYAFLRKSCKIITLLLVEFTWEDGKIFHFLVREHEHASGVGLVEDTLGVIHRHGLVSSTTASHLKGWLHNEEGLGVREQPMEALRTWGTALSCISLHSTILASFTILPTFEIPSDIFTRPIATTSTYTMSAYFAARSFANPVT